jgi:hypothetical protein
MPVEQYDCKPEQGCVTDIEQVDTSLVSSRFLFRSPVVVIISVTIGLDVDQ